MLARHRGFAAGAGVVLAPDALADAPRCIDWWWADQGIGQLEVDLDPASAEFYDYTTTEWYREPARTGRPCIAGPYVDYICTHKYTFTVSVPVVDDGRFVGVAGADILAGEVERMLLPGLSLLGRANRPAVLVSGNGRVIASGTARILPGTVLRPGRPGRGGRPPAVDAAQRAGACQRRRVVTSPRGLAPGGEKWSVQCGDRGYAGRARAVAWPHRYGRIPSVM